MWNDILGRYYDYVDAAARDADAGQNAEAESPDSEGDEGRSRKFRMQFGPKLKGSIGEGPNHSNFSSDFRNFC